MDIEPTDVTPVDTGSDDLDTFEKDFFSPSTKEAAPAKEEVKPDPVEDDTKSDDNQDNDDDTKTPDGDDDVEDKTDEKPKKKNTFQDRVNQLLERERLANERANEAQRKLDELASKQKETTPTPTPVVQNDGPNPDDTNPDGSEKYPLGEYDPEYIRDMARHTIDKEWNERKAKEEQEQNQRQNQEAREYLHNQWTEKLAPVTEQHEDFLEKTLELESTFEGLDPQFSDYLVQTIKSLDHGPEVLYYFANNLDEAQKFVKAGPLGATLALGEINAMFKGQTRKEAKLSSAPTPPPVNKGTKTRTAVPGDTDDLDAFEKEFFAKRR